MRVLFALALLAAPASAQPYGYPQQGYVVPRDQAAPYGYNQGQGTVQQLAGELSRATGYVQYTAAEDVGYSNYQDEREALFALRRLEQMARRFQSDANQFGGNAPIVRDDFDRLMRVYGHAANHVENLRGYPNIYQSFSRVQALMDQLAPYYGGYGHWGYSYEGRGYRMRGPDLQIGVPGFRFEFRR